MSPHSATVTTPEGVPLSAVVAHFGLEVLSTGGRDLDRRLVTTSELNRPGLQWAGYDEHFPAERIQLIGRAEVGYLMTLPEPQRWQRLRQYSDLGMPAAIVTRGLAIAATASGIADRHGVPLLRTSMATSDFASALNWFLALELAPRILFHAGLVDVGGEGVLILGRSGIGKSETALELIRRGHRLVADDTVEVRRPSDDDLVGRAPGRMRHFMEIKGIGIVNLRLMYGVASVKASGDLSMVVALERMDPARDFSKEPASMDILGVTLPLVTIPVRPGRHTAVLIETAAMAVRARRLGVVPSAPGLGAGRRDDLFGRLA